MSAPAWLSELVSGLAGLDPGLLLWPLLFGAGAYLVLTAQPIGRPKRDLAELLRRLDVDERFREETERRETRPIFASRLLEGLLRPVLDDAGRLLQRALRHAGVAGLLGAGSGDPSQTLEARLRLVRPEVEATQFFGEKVAAGLIGAGFFPLLSVLGLRPLGPWPFWLCVVALLVGFLAPDWALERRLARRRTLILLELPSLLDVLALAATAGLGLEQALDLVAREGRGIAARELGVVARETGLGERSLTEALEAMAGRNSVPELTALVQQLCTAHAQGLPLAEILAVQADGLREQGRLRLVEAGSRASVRMLLPVVLFILPVLFVILLAPAAVQLLYLNG